jgi:hypothetical protein
MFETYKVQIQEGMKPLDYYNEIGKCYQGSGYSMALYLFDRPYKRNEFLKNKNTYKIEPYIRSYEL